MGDNWYHMLVQKKDYELLEKTWITNDRIGWFILKEESRQYPDCWSCQLVYGSSMFNTKQMSRFIELIIQECQAQDIETITPDEKERLLQQWESYNG